MDLAQPLIRALIGDEADRLDVAAVLVLLMDPIDAEKLLTSLPELKHLRVPNRLLEPAGVDLANQGRGAITLDELYRSHRRVIPDPNRLDPFAPLQAHYIAASTILAAHVILEVALMVICKDGRAAGVVRVKKFGVLGVFRVIVPQGETHTMNQIVTLADLDICGSHEESLLGNVVYQVPNTARFMILLPSTLSYVFIGHVCRAETFLKEVGLVLSQSCAACKAYQNKQSFRDHNFNLFVLNRSK